MLKKSYHLINVFTMYLITKRYIALKKKKNSSISKLKKEETIKNYTDSIFKFTQNKSKIKVNMGYDVLSIKLAQIEKKKMMVQVYLKILGNSIFEDSEKESWPSFAWSNLN